MKPDPRAPEFEAMFRAHHDDVLAYALRRATDHDARDVVAETFLVAWRRFGEAPGDPRLPWLYGVARRVLANQRRAEIRRSALVNRLGPATSRQSSSDGYSGDTPLVEALTQLSDDDREVLLLLAWEGLNAEETALVLGCRSATVRMRIHRARKRLAALLAEPPSAVPSIPSIEPTS